MEILEFENTITKLIKFNGGVQQQKREQKNQ